MNHPQNGREFPAIFRLPGIFFKKYNSASNYSIFMTCPEVTSSFPDAIFANGKTPWRTQEPRILKEALRLRLPYVDVCNWDKMDGL